MKKRIYLNNQDLLDLHTVITVLSIIHNSSSNENMNTVINSALVFVKRIEKKVAGVKHG